MMRFLSYCTIIPVPVCSCIIISMFHDNPPRGQVRDQEPVTRSVSREAGVASRYRLLTLRPSMALHHRWGCGQGWSTKTKSGMWDQHMRTADNQISVVEPRLAQGRGFNISAQLMTKVITLIIRLHFEQFAFTIYVFYNSTTNSDPMPFSC